MFDEYVIRCTLPEETIEKHEADVKERIEILLSEKYDIEVDLQQMVEDGDYFLFAHSDTWEWLEEEYGEEAIDRLVGYGIDEDEEATTYAIKNLLSCSFEVVKVFERPDYPLIRR